MIYLSYFDVNTDGKVRFFDPFNGLYVANDSITFSRGEIPSLTFDIYRDNDYYDEFEAANKMRVFAYDSDRDEYVFRGRVVSVSKTMQDESGYFRTVTCEGAEGFLMDTQQTWYSGSAFYGRDTGDDGGTAKKWWDCEDTSTISAVIMSDETRKVSAKEAVRIILDQHNRKVSNSYKRVYYGNVTVDGNVYLSETWDVNSWDALQSIVEELGGEMRVSYVKDSTLGWANFLYYMPVLGTKGSDGTKKTVGTLALGDNMGQCTKEVDINDIVTRIKPFGDSYQEVKVETSRTGTAQDSGVVFKSGKRKTGVSGGGCRRYSLVDSDGNLAFDKVHINVKTVVKGYDVACFRSLDDDTEDTVGHLTAGKDATDKDYWIAVPDESYYLYVSSTEYGSDDITVTMYNTQPTNSSGVVIGSSNRLGLSKYLNDDMKDWFSDNGITINGGYLECNTDKYGVVEETLLIEGLVDTSKLTDQSSKKGTIDDIEITDNDKEKFCKFAGRTLLEKCSVKPSVTLTAYDLSLIDSSYSAMRMYDWWKVTNKLVDLDTVLEIVGMTMHPSAIETNTVELGRKKRKSTRLISATKHKSDKLLWAGSSGVSVTGDEKNASKQYVKQAIKTAVAASSTSDGGTTYTPGTGISISDDNVISSALKGSDYIRIDNGVVLANGLVACSYNTSTGTLTFTRVS